MKCSQCNQEISDTSRFCSYCGAMVERPAAEDPETTEADVHKLCPGCRTVFSTDHVYCDRCGRLLKLRRIEGKELQKIAMLSKYEGSSSFGIAKPTGDLVIYDNRIEFQRKAENAAVAFWDAAGMRSSIKKDPVVETYKMDEIESVHAGKRAGIMPALIVQMKDHRVFSFCGLSDSNGIRKAAELIEDYRA